jgi:hypothetical protein
VFLGVIPHDIMLSSAYSYLTSLLIVMVRKFMESAFLSLHGDGLLRFFFDATTLIEFLACCFDVHVALMCMVSYMVFSFLH